MAQDKRDVFICHAGEDKEEVVQPLVEACIQAGISCWYDEAEIQWGDSITHKVNDGLSISEYVVVVLSSAFLGKNWPRRELNAVLNQEASTGKVRVLPLLVGSEEDKQKILRQLPLLNDKRYLSWDADPAGVVSALFTRLGRCGRSDREAPATLLSAGLRIPLPNIKKGFSQRDRDLFLRNAFTIVNRYFERALQELKRHSREVETDLVNVHNLQFVATIYIAGEVANKCKVWLARPTSSDSIAYYEGQSCTEGDNSYHDWLTVEDDGRSLGLRPGGISFGPHNYAAEGLLSAERAAEYLWSRFTNNLDRD